nr:DUF6318 family protein [Jonesia denitrificans]
MRQKRIPATLTSIALFATLGLTACTTNTDPTPPPPSTTTTPDTTPEPQPEPTETPTSDPTAPSGPPEKPAAMANNDEEGALAAAEYFLDASAYALLMGDERLMKEFAAAHCTFCDTLLNEIEVDKQNGRTRTLVNFSITGETKVTDRDNAWIIEAPVTFQGAHQESDGKNISGKPQTWDGTLFLFNKNGNWSFDNLTLSNEQ